MSHGMSETCLSETPFNRYDSSLSYNNMNWKKGSTLMINIFYSHFDTTKYVIYIIASSREDSTKVFERCMYDRLAPFLDKYNMLC